MVTKAKIISTIQTVVAKDMLFEPEGFVQSTIVKLNGLVLSVICAFEDVPDGQGQENFVGKSAG